jgi:hypothetical protein
MGPRNVMDIIIFLIVNTRRTNVFWENLQICEESKNLLKLVTLLGFKEINIIASADFNIFPLQLKK